MTPNSTLTCERVWRYGAAQPLTQWYGHVHIAGPDVIGQWMRLDLKSGACHWHRNLGRPNTLVGMTDTILIATEMRSDGPWTRSFGAYGIDRASGQTRWIAHAEGWVGRLWRVFDRVPGFTNGLRDTPVRVDGDRCICSSGRVLSTETGLLIDRVSSLPDAPSSRAYQLYSDGRITLPVGTLRVDSSRSNFRIGLESKGRMCWHLSVSRRGRHIDGNYFSWRLVGQYLVLLVSKQPQLISIGRYTVRSNPADFVLWFVNVLTGVIAHREPVARRATDCRIEDVTPEHVLISHDRRHLQCFQWSSSTP